MGGVLLQDLVQIREVAETMMPTLLLACGNHEMQVCSQLWKPDCKPYILGTILPLL